jgi:acetylornithine deacetylase
VALKVGDLLGELIAIPSVNPRLNASLESGNGEQHLTEYLQRFFTSAGWQWALEQVHPGRSNVIALVRGGRGDALLWEAHQDTVNAERMSIDPFAASTRDGRIYGRGACDVKGSMAAMLVALTMVASEPAHSRPNILFAATVNEECGFTGARALADIWRGAEYIAFEDAGGLTLDQLRALRPRAAIVAEPTELNVVVAHRGVARWRCTVQGRAAHSSRPEDGANAIYAMAHIIRQIEGFHSIELGSRPADPLCGPSTACVTTIRGGTGPNTVPDRVVIDIDRRLTPCEQPEGAFEELVAYLAARTELEACRVEHEAPWMQSHGLAGDANRPWAEAVAAVARQAGVEAKLMGVPYGTNAASIAAAGIPTVVFGPGSIAQAHTADEWITVDQLNQAVDVLHRIASGAAPPPL